MCSLKKSINNNICLKAQPITCQCIIHNTFETMKITCSLLCRYGMNEKGAVVCFVIYVILCAQIVSLIEHRWLEIPKNIQFTYAINNQQGVTVKVCNIAPS